MNRQNELNEVRLELSIQLAKVFGVATANVIVETMDRYIDLCIDARIIKRAD